MHVSKAALAVECPFDSAKVNVLSITVDGRPNICREQHKDTVPGKG